MDTRPNDVSAYCVGEQNCKRDTLIKFFTVYNTGNKFKDRYKLMCNFFSSFYRAH